MRSISDLASLGDIDIRSNVVIYGEVEIDDFTTIFDGSVIGREPMAAGIISHKPNAIGKTRIGKRCVIGANAIIYQGAVIGDDCLVGDGTTIRENTTIGNNTVVGSNVTIQNGAVIGDRVKIVDLSHITFDCTIGDDSFISVGVYTMNDNSMARGGEVIGPKIGKRVRIGGGALLLPGIIVGDDAIIGAGSVVTKDVPEGGKVMGIPAKTKAEMVSYNYEHFYEFEGWPERASQKWPPE